MKLANLVGINVAQVSYEQVLGRDILLVQRFDRVHTGRKVVKKSMLSGLSLLNLNEMEARYASYQDLADLIRQKFSNHRELLKELFNRIAFNILIGNTDDHARNHCAFWDGVNLTLTPAYDICPQTRIGYEATQAMVLGGKEGNHSTLLNLLSIADKFLINQLEAKQLIQRQIDVLLENWQVLCEEVQLKELDRKQLWRSTVYSDYCLQGWGAQ